MEATSPINRHNMKSLTTSVLGLVVLFGLSEGSLGVAVAKEVKNLGKPYCTCMCSAPGAVKRLKNWSSMDLCMANGKQCTFKRDSDGKQVEGILSMCDRCQDKTDGTQVCTEFKNLQGTTPSPSGLPGTVEPGPRTPPTTPFSKSGMNAPIMKRGVEGEQPADTPSGSK